MRPLPAASSTLLQALPTHDWQFWVVTLVFALALLWLGRGLLPFGKKGRARGKPTRVTLTISGKAHEKPKPPGPSGAAG